MGCNWRKRRVWLIQVVLIAFFSFVHLLSEVKLLETLSVEVDKGVEEMRESEADVKEVDNCKVDPQLICEDKSFCPLNNWQSGKNNNDA